LFFYEFHYLRYKLFFFYFSAQIELHINDINNFSPGICTLGLPRVPGYPTGTRVIFYYPPLPGYPNKNKSLQMCYILARFLTEFMESEYRFIGD